MQGNMNLNVRIGNNLSGFVSQNIGENGDYDNVSEYIRDLIRRDKAQKENKLFLQLKAELQVAYGQPESDYEVLTAKDIILRNTMSA